MASAIEDLRDISKDLTSLEVDLKELFEKTARLALFLDEQIERLEED